MIQQNDLPKYEMDQNHQRYIVCDQPPQQKYEKPEFTAAVDASGPQEHAKSNQFKFDSP